MDGKRKKRIKMTNGKDRKSVYNNETKKREKRRKFRRSESSEWNGSKKGWNKIIVSCKWKNLERKPERSKMYSKEKSIWTERVGNNSKEKSLRQS